MNQGDRISTASIIQTKSILKENEVKKKTNFLSYSEGINTLLANMKMYDEQNSTRNLDDSRMRVLNALEETSCRSEVDKANEEQNTIDIQLDKNDKHMEKLLNRARELIENIKMENERSGYNNRAEQIENRAQLEPKLYASSIQTAAEYEQIMCKWTELQEEKEAFNLKQKLDVQKQHIVELMQHKDEIIDECKTQIANMNEVYLDNFKDQNLNIILLIERIKAAVDISNQAYSQTVQDFEDKLNVERTRMQDEFHANANENLQQTVEFVSETENNLKVKFNSYTDRFQNIQQEQEDMTRLINIQLDLESDNVLREMANQRTLMLMNSEKIDYNLQVVQNRNNETIQVLNQQKRRITRLMEVLNQKISKRAKLEKSIELECTKLYNDIKKLQELICDMHVKSRKLRTAHKRTFDSIWKLNYTDVVQSSKQIITVDRMICEFLCDAEYIEPEIDVTDINYEEPKKQKISGQSLLKNKKPTLFHDNRMLQRLMRYVLRQISDRGGVFVERKLLTMLKEYGEKNECLVRVENIFKALHITNTKLLEALFTHFQPYAWCPNCMDGLSDQVVKDLMEKSSTRTSRVSAISRLSEISNKSKTADIESNTVKKSVAQCTNHYLITEQAFVLTILNKFANNVCVGMQRKSLEDEIYGIQPSLINIDVRTIKQFFLKFLEYFNETKLNHWKTVEHALNHYIFTLRKRMNLHDQVQSLQIQTQELTHLLSKV